MRGSAEFWSAVDTPYDQYRSPAEWNAARHKLVALWQKAAAASAEEDTEAAAASGAKVRSTPEKSIVQLIGLSGYGQTGKDTAAAFMADAGFTRIAFADQLKRVAIECRPHFDVSDSLTRWSLGAIVCEYGWEEAKRVPGVRLFLQHLGVAVRDHVDPDAWVTAAMRLVQPGRRYVFTDVRFPNEAQAIKARGGVIVRVHRPGVGAVNAHASETALDDWDFDAHLFNDGDLDRYHVRVRLLLEELL